MYECNKYYREVFIPKNMKKIKPYQLFPVIHSIVVCIMLLCKTRDVKKSFG